MPPAFWYSPEIALELIEQGADFGPRNDEGATPLHFAARGNAWKTMLELIRQGADIHARTIYERTLLHFAALGNAREVAMKLIELGADFTATDDAGQTPRGVARKEGRDDVEALLGAASRWIQLGLAAAGFDPGPTDGWIGEAGARSAQAMAGVAWRGANGVSRGRFCEGVVGGRGEARGAGAPGG